MLEFQKTRVLESIEAPVAEGFTVTGEGKALVMDYTGGVANGVKESAGVAGEKFYGVSLAQQMTLLFVPEFFTIVASAAVVAAPHIPAAGTLLVYDVTAGAPLAAAGGAVPATGEYALDGKNFTFHADQTGNEIRISYRYSPTTIEARTIQGDIPPGGAASLTLDKMGVILKGQVSTTEFDTSVNWAVTAPVLKLGANGLFTLGGAGIEVPGAVVTGLPTDGGFLVFEL